MRFTKHRAYAYPVLGQRDYHYQEGARFVAGLKARLRHHAAILGFESKVADCCETVEDLIADDKARFAVWVYCQSTSYRKMFVAEAAARTVHGEIECELQHETVELHPQIIAHRDLDLPLIEANPVYCKTGPTIRVEAGCPIAVNGRPWKAKISPDQSGERALFDYAEDDSITRAQVWDFQTADDPGISVLKLAADRDSLDEMMKWRKATPWIAEQWLVVG